MGDPARADAIERLVSFGHDAGFHVRVDFPVGTESIHVVWLEPIHEDTTGTEEPLAAFMLTEDREEVVIRGHKSVMEDSGAIHQVLVAIGESDEEATQIEASINEHVGDGAQVWTVSDLHVGNRDLQIRLDAREPTDEQEPAIPVVEAAPEPPADYSGDYVALSEWLEGVPGVIRELRFINFASHAGREPPPEALETQDYWYQRDSGIVEAIEQAGWRVRHVDLASDGAVWLELKAAAWHPPTLFAAIAEAGGYTERLYYVVIDEIADEVAGLSPSYWPMLDEEGHLVFGEVSPPDDLAISTPDLEEFLNSHRAEQLAETPGAVEVEDRPEVVLRAVRLGDAFAMNEAGWGDLTRLGRVSAGEEPAGSRQVSEASLVVDITKDAREQAKIAFYAAAAPVIEPETSKGSELVTISDEEEEAEIADETKGASRG